MPQMLPMVSPLLIAWSWVSWGRESHHCLLEQGGIHPYDLGEKFVLN